jgi:S-methylmethionine-dependent homocysteine/selenocysteine methylase
VSAGPSRAAARAGLPAGVLILDGATGTELDRRGVDVSLPLWSARALVEAPQAVQSVHEAYLRAGADAVTTCTFRTHRRSLARAGWGSRAAALTRRAVELARAAAAAANPTALVLGSVAPLEDCYRPELSPDGATCRREHEELMTHLLDAGVDLLLIETMNTLREATAAVEAARTLAPGRYILSLCMRPDAPAGRLLSGESIGSLVRELADAAAVGANCVAAPAMDAQVRALRASVPARVRVAAYANVGCADAEGNWVSTDAIDPQGYLAYARGWVESGASIVGGCCGTRPATIAALAAAWGGRARLRDRDQA